MRHDPDRSRDFLCQGEYKDFRCRGDHVKGHLCGDRRLHAGGVPVDGDCDEPSDVPAALGAEAPPADGDSDEEDRDEQDAPSGGRVPPGSTLFTHLEEKEEIMWPFYISGGAALIAVLILLAMKYKKQLPTILMLPLFPFFFIAFLVYVFVNPKERRRTSG